MCHIEKRASGIPLYSHVLGFGQPSEGAQSARPCNLGLVLLVRSEVGDTTNSIALDLDIWRHHLLDKRLESAELDNQDLVVG